jgi:hypothetical protein
MYFDLIHRIVACLPISIYLSIYLDGMVNLCKLADIGHRINRANEHDSHQVAHWIDVEQQRHKDTSAQLQARQHRIACLNGSDSRSLLDDSVKKLSAEVSVLTNVLTAAEEEEEAARKVRTSYSSLMLVFMF